MPWRKAWFESPMKMETTVEREWKWLTRNLSCGERSAVWRGLAAIVRLLDVAMHLPLPESHELQLNLSGGGLLLGEEGHRMRTSARQTRSEDLARKEHVE